MKTRIGCFAVTTGISLLMFLANSAALAQTTRGTITGAVTDESGAIVAGASVTVTQIDTGISHTATADRQGNYVVPSLFPGRYRVEGEFKGFQKTVIEPLQLHVDERLTVEVVLKVGQFTQKVEVTSQGELLQTGTFSIGQVIGSQLVVDLPLNGRNFLQLGLLSPGATTTQATADTSGFGSINISGGRASSNQYSLDGAYNNNVIGEGLNFAISVDAIQEFKVQRNTFNAEFGFGTAQVNVATKSGSNEFHGSVYEFLRNNDLDARQFRDTSIPPFQQNQFGGTFGGPIRKNRTFFFFNYEGFRRSQGNTLIGTLPSAMLLSGDFSGLPPIHDPQTGKPFPGNVIPSSSFSALTNRILPFLPRLATGGANNFQRTPSTTQDWNQATVRVDHRLSSKDDLFARYSFFTSLQSFTPGLIIQTGTTSKDAPQNGSLQWTHSFSPSLLNEFRFGFDRTNMLTVQEGAFTKNILQFQNMLNSPINFGLPTVNLGPFGGFGTVPNIPAEFGSNTYQYEDSLTWVHGRHTMKFGGGFRNVQVPHDPTFFSRGIFVFAGAATGNPVADFLLGFPFVSIGGGTPKGVSAFLSFHHYEWFVQDDWKVSPSLTFNLGMRYERIGVNTDRFRGRLTVFDEKTGQEVPASQQAQLGLINPDNNDFGPRFGFAWQPFHTSSTVVRGGYGVYYDVKAINERNFSLGAELKFQQIVDIALLAGMPPAVSWDNLWPPLTGGASLGTLSDDPRARTPYVQQYSFGIERSLAHDMIVEVDYVGSVGRKLNLRVDINQATLPTVLGQPLQSRRPYPSFSSVLMSKDLGTSNYNSLQARLEKRFSHNLSFLAAYTYMRSLDTGSSTNDLANPNAGSPQNVRNMKAEYGVSSFNQPQRLTFTSIYQLPFGSGQRYLSTLPKGFNAAVKGWQLNTILTIATGQPFTVQVPSQDREQIGTFLGGTQRANCIGQGNLPRSQRTANLWFNTIAFQVAPLGTFGNCARNTVTGPGTNNWDLSLFKNTPITEKTSLQFRAEFFNAWNHPQFGIPIFDPTAQAFGRINSFGPARQIQFALKLLF